MPAGPGEQSLETLQRELGKAREIFEAAKRDFNLETKEAQSIGLANVDGAHLLGASAKRYNLALAEYAAALQRYTDYVLNNTRYRCTPR